jgi:hypothetical protein
MISRSFAVASVAAPELAVGTLLRARVDIVGPRS